MHTTWLSQDMGPTTLWVEARHVYDYLNMGYEIVDYESPPDWLRGCWSGRAQIQKPGSEFTHVWSPELVSLHKHVGHSFDSLFKNVKALTPTWNRIHEAHSLLFNEYRYHEDLISVERYTKTEISVPRDRIVGAIRTIADTYSGRVQKVLLKWAQRVEAFSDPPTHTSSHSSLNKGGLKSWSRKTQKVQDRSV